MMNDKGYISQSCLSYKMFRTWSI